MPAGVDDGGIVRGKSLTESPVSKQCIDIAKAPMLKLWLPFSPLGIYQASQVIMNDPWMFSARLVVRSRSFPER